MGGVLFGKVYSRTEPDPPKHTETRFQEETPPTGVCMREHTEPLYEYVSMPGMVSISCLDSRRCLK
jgi:hypothetical protein